VSPAPELFACAEQAMRAKRYSEADGICRDILQTQPGFAAALGLRGLVAAIEGDTARAIALLEAALAGQPGNAALRSALSDAYRLCGRLDEALALAQAVVRQAPRQAAFRINLAKVHHDRGDLDRGASEFLAALAMEPENANAHLGLGQILLSREQYRPGWIEYEWRNKIEHVLSKYKGLNAAMWNGMPLRDDRILLIGDQGYGDTLQFSRYIPMVAARCREVAVGCAAELVPLLGKMDGVGIAHARWTDIPGFTAYALLSSLPYIFGTDEVTIPSGLPYLHADAARIAHWRTRLDEAAPRGRRVGLFWSGRQSHPNNTRRSMPLSTLRGLADLPGFVPVSLQKEWPGDCRQDSMPGLVRFDAELTDFGETAALIHNLDLVVSVDSAVVHLAGAMGRPAWLMAATPADWRWLLGRSDSPWYPSIRIFRQTKGGEWDGVIDAIKEAWPPP
jgi:tetratricopeptide (TPR) repeat protein